VRVIRACRDLGVRTVAVFSEPDRAALHVRLADEAYPIGPAPASESYLRSEAILDVARRSGAEALHPGYGFLAENADFAQACADAGIVFVGPPPAAMRTLGEKTAARRLANDVGVPIVRGTLTASRDPREIIENARGIGVPVMLKAAAGGGGKGMRLVSDPRALEIAVRGAMGEAQSAFADPSLFVEAAVAPARHVEMQFVADARGHAVWLGERDCSIQRRHQKIIEEAPGPSVDPALRERLGDYALRLAREAGYVNAGTAEFLIDDRGEAHFLEINARLQVEHPVTEAVTGLDLVALQLAVAAGEELPFGQGDIALRGAAIECRISAEDVERDFLPSAGRVTVLREPAGPGVRVDSCLYAGMEVPTEYDPLLAKIVTHGRDRAEARTRMRRALAETAIGGVRTTLPFHRRVLDEPAFASGRYDTGFVAVLGRDEGVPPDHAIAAAAYAAIVDSRARPAAPRPSPASAWLRQSRADLLRSADPPAEERRWSGRARQTAL
jgi:acetyl/propionyl-CoA carboxylase alpha subunit